VFVCVDGVVNDEYVRVFFRQGTCSFSERWLHTHRRGENSLTYSRSATRTTNWQGDYTTTDLRPQKLANLQNHP
jgi:hypothetical protein